MKVACIAVAFLAATACKDKGDDKKTKESEKKDPKTKPVDATPAPKVITLEGFDTPESVLYDAAEGVYLVSNIGGGNPLEKDDKAFISRIQPDGKVELRWIDSAKDDVTLDAPKGMAILGDLLYVTDIDVVRMFDRKTGAPRGEIAVPGATFLNDLAAADGPLWVSDTGIKFGASGPEPTGSDAIYRIMTGSNPKVQKIIAGKDLGNPNGLFNIGDDEVWVVTFGSGEIYKVSYDDEKKVGARTNIKKLPKGRLDGIAELPGCATDSMPCPMVVSSWEASAIYQIAPDGTATELITGVESPADIDVDPLLRRVLIPLFTTNTVEIHTL